MAGSGFEPAWHGAAIQVAVVAVARWCEVAVGWSMVSGSREGQVTREQPEQGQHEVKCEAGCDTLGSSNMLARWDGCERGRKRGIMGERLRTSRQSGSTSRARRRNSSGGQATR